MNIRFKRFKLYICCCVLLVSFFPAAGQVQAYHYPVEDMQGSRLPAGTTYTASEPSRWGYDPYKVADDDRRTFWGLFGTFGYLQLNFPNKVHMNAIQLATNSFTHGYHTYKIEGLQNGQWSEIGRKTQKVKEEEYVVLAPIPVTEGWYDSIRITIQSTSYWMRINEIHYISDLNSPTGLQARSENRQIRLNWVPVPGADGYQIRYGTKSGSYTEAVNVSADTYGGFTLPDLQENKPYYFVVAAQTGEQLSNYSNEMFGMPLSGFDFPDDVQASVNPDNVHYFDGASNIIDRDLSTGWRFQGSGIDAELYLKSDYPVYMDELQLVMTSEATDNYFIGYVYTGGNEEEPIVAHEVEMEKAGEPGIWTIPIKPGWYKDLKLQIVVSRSPLIIHEIRYNTEHTPVQNLQATSDNQGVALTWEPVAGADGYRIVYGQSLSDIDQGQAVTVSKDAYAGYTVTGLASRGAPYQFLVQALHGDESYGYSNMVSSTLQTYRTGDFLPPGTRVTATGSYQNDLPQHAADGNLRSYWHSDIGNWYELDQGNTNGTINFTFPQPISIQAVQPVTGMYPSGSQSYTIYGLQNRQWILLYKGKVEVPYHPNGGILKPIPIKSGEYSGLMINIDAGSQAVTLQELLVFYNHPAGTVMGDTYGTIPLPTVSADTYQ
ncbi:fibronectin type III domain-containing protein [Paenibacillus dauci]|uniref:fibronectin type III domain-containing protein n=1 Tax=Paenibacillus dauci TaxID=1567106 RepID=UPI0006190BB1|nr:fibronectin type III domain-containing protein [Paenibacillus dauci]